MKIDAFNRSAEALRHPKPEFLGASEAASREKTADDRGLRMVIVDTTVWIDYLTGATNAETEWLERELTRQRLGLTDLTLCKVLQGIRDDADFQQVRDQLQSFQVHETGGSEMAVAAAENYRRLRKKGFTVRKTLDCWIATYCLLSGNQLLHRDRDFYPFEKVLGLKVVKA